MLLEGIDMNNPNTLVALAYIKVNDNPLLVFCNYILDALMTAPDRSLRNDELLANLQEKFGLDMKQSMINNCISILKKKGEVKYLTRGAGYAIDKTNFDVNEFEANMQRLHTQEDAVIASLIQFVRERYNIFWDSGKAKGYLSFFLNEMGNAARLFMDEGIEIENNGIRGSWYVGRFIDYIQGNDKVERRYLEDINNGLMIYQGIYQTNDYQQDKTQKFKGTVFYFDTKMILRLAGYSVEMHIRATQELAQLIREDYGGKIGIFDKTVKEVKNALYVAGKRYNEKKSISDTELAMFAERNPAGASLLCEASYSIDNLLKKYGIVREPEVSWEAEKYHKYWIKTDEVEDYIKGKFNWKEGAVSNDVQVINQINILREGDYTVRYGGQKKRPVFVTTNIGLVYSFREYLEETSKTDTQSYWNPHALPVISENMLVSRLWVPYAKKYSDLPALTLARQAYAAQNPVAGFFEKLKDVAIEYKEMNNIDIFDIDELRKQQLEDILVAKTQGDVEALTPETVSSSIEELVMMQNVSLQEELAISNEVLKQKDEKLEESGSSIVRLLADRYANKLGWRRIIIWMAEYWWIFVTLACEVVAYLVSKPLDSKWPYLVALLPMVLEMILAILDEYLEKKEWHEFILCCAVKYVWGWYVKKILCGIQEEDNLYQNDVVLRCLDRTPVFAEHKEWCSM